MARGQRRRLKKDIYTDNLGLSGRVYYGGQRREKRFAFGTPLDEIQTWINRTREILKNETPQTPRGTLGKDADTYYKSVKDLQSFMARRAEVRAWIRELGPNVRRSAITTAIVRTTRGVWLDAGVAPKTINNRVFALAHLYRTIDGHKYPTPCDELDPLPVHKRPAVRIPDELIRTMEANMRTHEAAGWLKDQKTRARFMVFAATGHRPSEIGRAERGDVDLERRVWIPRDGKGGFCPGVYLNDDMLEAWKLFIDAKAWGEFDSGSFARRIRKAGLPAHLTPYQLRHTVGIALSESGVDLQDISDHLGHKHISTTRKHYVPVLESRLQRASEVLNDRRLGWDAQAPTLAAARPKPRKKK